MRCTAVSSFAVHRHQQPVVCRSRLGKEEKTAGRPDLMGWFRKANMDELHDRRLSTMSSTVGSTTRKR